MFDVNLLNVLYEISGILPFVDEQEEKCADKYTYAVKMIQLQACNQTCI